MRPSQGANPNRIALELVELRDSSRALTDPADFKNPAPVGSPVFVDKVCVENGDVAVTFDLTVMRRANQGFFDVAVNFEDLFCSAKVDCERDGGATLDLLFDPVSGERVPTIVMTLACTGGAAADTHLWMDRPRLVCNGQETVLPIDGDEPGQVYTTNPDGPIRQLATYRGSEALSGPGGVSWAKLYANVAIAIDPGQSCSLTGVATASDGLLDEFTTPPGAYPLIRWNVPALTDTTRPICGQMPLDDDGPTATPGVGTFTAYTMSPKAFDFGLKKDPSSPTRLVVLRGGDVCDDGLCTGAETGSSCPEDCLEVCPAGTWGARCDAVCIDANCAGALTCDRVTGATLTCSECVAGQYGPLCAETCTASGCDGPPTCDRESGEVESCQGCLAGFFGPLCDSDWWDTSFTRRSTVTVTATSIPSGATHVQVPIDVDTLCYGTRLPNLLYAYHFDEGTGTTLTSREGHGGFSTLDRGGTFTPGIEGTALRLDGTSQWVDLPDLLPTTSSMTLAAWFRPSALPSGYPGIVSAWGTSGQPGGEVYIMSLTEAQFCQGGGTGVKLIQKVHPVGQAEHGKCNAEPLETDRWYMAALTYNGRVERGYLDGVEEVFHDYGAVSTLEASSTLRLGVARDLATHFPGDVDSVMLFDGVLDDTDITSLKNPRCRRDLGDLRLFDATTGDVYPYWRESDHRIIARVPVAALSGHVLHLYHGNPTAVSPSNGPATFELFEGFDGNAMQGSWSLTAGCAVTGPLPGLANERLVATGNCGVLASAMSFGTERLNVAVDVFKPLQTGESLSCVDARLGWSSVNVLGTLKLDNFNPEWGDLDLVGIGAAHECNWTTGFTGFNLGTFELTQNPGGTYISRYGWVDGRVVEGPLPFSFPAAKGPLVLHAAGTTAAPRYYDNLRVSVAANVSAALSPACTYGSTCASYRWVDVGPRTEPVRTGSCVNGSGASAICNANNLGRRIHVDTTAGSSVQFQAVGATANTGSVPGGAAFLATLSPDGATLDYTGRGSGCTWLTTTLVSLEHVYECQMVP